MSRCPICQSVRIVVVVSLERKAFCTACGSRWVQDGSEQRSVRRGQPSLSRVVRGSLVREA